MAPIPPIENLSEEELKQLQKLLAMSDEETEAHFRLISNEPVITAFFSKRKAWALVFGSVNRAILWFAGISGAIFLGFDKIKAMLAYLLQSLLLA